jgi:hydroxymethylpyrimidine/phosphomethylpyrimidine kinase
MENKPTYKVLTIAGSDPSGGAGIQADIKTITALGGYAASVITALTIQNTLGVTGIFAVPPSVVSEQIAAVMEDIAPPSIKIGMVKDAAIVRCIAASIQKYRTSFIVYDPVMVSTSGHRLIDDDVIEIIQEELIPQVSLITPNMHEAEVLLGRKIGSIAEMEAAAMELASRFRIHVLVKGGHLEGDGMCDILACPDGMVSHFMDVRIETRNLHGTGCTLSSAIATLVARQLVEENRILSDKMLVSAIGKAKKYVTAAIREGSKRDIGKGNGPLWHQVQDA